MIQIAMIRGAHTQVAGQFLEDIAQRRRDAHPFRHGKGQPMGLARPVIGILPQYHNLDRIERGQFERAQPHAARREDRLARFFLRPQPVAQPAGFG